MPVKLNSSGGGSVTLTTPSTATDYTATFPAATGSVVLSNTSGTATVTDFYATNVYASGTVQMGSSFKRNRIINGNMQIWQRATTYSLTNSYIYGSADRWETDMGSTAAATASQSTSVPTTAGQLFQYSMKVQRTASSTSTGNIVVAQAIETSNSYDLAGSSATLSFYAKCGANYSPTSSALNALVFFGQGTDQSITNMRNNAWTGQTNAGGAATLTTSWQRFTFTVSVPAGTTQLGMQVYASPTGTAGADDSFYITGVQLEVGSVATPYERQIYSDQLAQCQRYYQKIDGFITTGSTTTTVIAVVEFNPVMRTSPSVSATAAIKISDNVAADFTQSSASASIVNGTRVTSSSVNCSINNFTGLTTYRPYQSVPNETGFLAFSAEL
jgi:hypothetical protein